jgi:alkylhydroperoxidase family enzyme
MSKVRLEPLPPPYSAKAQTLLDTLLPDGMPVLNIFATVAHNPRVLERMLAGGLLDKGSISLADRELVILRTCALCNAEYEWGVHVIGFAAAAGFSREQAEATTAVEVDPALWTDKQRTLIATVDALHQAQCLSDDLWERLAGHYANDQLVEIVMLAGLYHAVSFVVNAFGVQHETAAPRFP